MSLLEIVVLFVVMALLALLPSTSVALVVARSSTAGFLNGAAVAAGILLGDLLFVGLAVLGMAALAEVMGSFFLVLRYLAGLYLIWFGIGLLRSNRFLQARSEGSASTLSASFLAGLLVTLGDVKAILFYASLFPAFVDLSAVQASDIAMIAVITVVAVGGVKLGYAYYARRLVSLIRGVKTQRAVSMAAGGVMVGAGTYLLTKS